MTEQEFLEKIHSILGFTPKDKVIESLRHNNVWIVLMQASEIKSNVEIITRFSSLKAEISNYEKANASLIVDPMLAEGKVKIRSKILSDTLELAKVIAQYHEKQLEESKQNQLAHQQRWEKIAEDMRRKHKDRVEGSRFKKTHGLNKLTIAISIVLGVATLVQNYHINEKNQEIETLKDKVKQLEARTVSPVPKALEVEGPTIGPTKQQKTLPTRPSQ